MTPEQRRRVRDVFEAALDCSPAERAAWIDRETRDDRAVGDEVRSLIDQDARAGAFLDRPVLDSVPDLMSAGGLAPGAVVGAYTVVREIGRGGMGLVYLASDRRLKRLVALKALAPHLVGDERQRARLHREAVAAARLTHPGICTVYALEEIEGELYLATEFVDGRTLRDEIRSQPRPSGGDVARMARELSAALASAHECGVTHGDLKPENVMRTNDGRLKILDFGLARIEASLPPSTNATWPAVPGALLGTPAYMAPEQLKGQPANQQGDVFALGVLLYEYAAGTHPFEAASPIATMARVLEGDLLPLGDTRRDLPPGVVDVVTRCLRRAPAERFRSASEVVAALDRGQRAPPSLAGTGWWRIHQCGVVALYVGAVALGWQLKEWLHVALAVATFMALGVGATIGGVLRGHLLFTERVNGGRLTAERRRIRRAVLAVDFAMAAALTVDALLLVGEPLVSVLTIGLALGLLLAAAVVEPATVRAAFGEE